MCLYIYTFMHMNEFYKFIYRCIYKCQKKSRFNFLLTSDQKNIYCYIAGHNVISLMIKSGRPFSMDV